MKIKTRYVGDVRVFDFSGTARAHEWEHASDQIKDSYSKGEMLMIINWRDVEHINSASLQILVRLINIKRNDPAFVFALVTDNPTHKKIIKSVGFDKFVHVVATEDDALELVKSSKKPQAADS